MFPYGFSRGLLAVSAAGIVLSATAQAQTALSGSTDADANPDPVYVFNRICYAQVPNVQAIRDMSAKLAWKSMEQEDLAQFKTVDEPKVLDGWDVQVGERLFRVGIQQSGLTDAQKKAFPKLTDGTVTTCSVVLDEQQNASEFLPNMTTLAGKEPLTSNVSEGSLATTTWAGGSEDLKVFLIAKTPVSTSDDAGKGGLLNVTVLQK